MTSEEQIWASVWTFIVERLPDWAALYAPPIAEAFAVAMAVFMRLGGFGWFIRGVRRLLGHRQVSKKDDDHVVRKLVDIKATLKALQDAANAQPASADAPGQTEAAGDRAQAEKWRRQGALAYDVDTARSRDAHAKAAPLEPVDFDTHIYLGRLHQRGGNLPAARAALQAGEFAATADRDRSVSLTELGDVARAEGDLPAADATNTTATQDAGVSLAKRGRLAEASENRAEASRWIPEAADVFADLSARAPGIAELERMRDLTAAARDKTCAPD